MITATDVEKTFDNIEPLCIIKKKKQTSQQSGCKRNVVWHNTSQNMTKFTASIILSGDKLKTFHLKPGTRPRCPFLSFYSTSIVSPSQRI